MKNRVPQEDSTAETATLARSPIHLLHRAGQCAADIFTAEMAGLDLTPRQFAVLLTVSMNEGPESD
jgi:hypothetical protein